MIKKPRFPIHRIGEAVQMYRSGITLNDISRKMNCHCSTLIRHLSKQGIELSENEKQSRAKVLREKKEMIAIQMGKGNRSKLRDSAESCVLCLYSIGIGKRVISRVMGLPDGLAQNVIRANKAKGQKMIFREMKSKTPDSVLKRRNQQIARSLRARVRDAVKSMGRKKNFSARNTIGCSLNEFRIHLESKFEPWMNWSNYGTKWHIDHIIPCAKFNLLDDSEIKRCFHWTNMRPLCATKNLCDGDRKGIHQQPFLML